MRKYDQLSDREKATLIKREYLSNLYSFEMIASDYDTYANKVRRDAIRFGIPIRTKSQAQKEALNLGRHKHPTKGTQRTEATKDKIGKGVMKAWKDIDDVEFRRRQETAKANWDKLSEDDKAERFRKANEAIRQTSKEGSKLEKYLYETLLEEGYRAEPHKEHILSNTKLHIDIFLPQENIAIEVDGPSHFEPVWGEVALEKAKVYDSKKNGLLIGKGLKLIRVKQTKDFSKARASVTAENLLKSIQKMVEGNVTFMEIGDE